MVDKNLQNLVSIVVPAYKEAANLPELARQISDSTSRVCLDYELIIVDDDSPDHTKQTADKLIENGHPIRLIIRKGQRDLSTAVLTGFRQAKGSCLICMDADLSHPAAVIPELIEALSDDKVDIAVGSRYVSGGRILQGCSWVMRINSFIATLLARPFTRIKDPMSGFFAIRSSVFQQAADLNPIGYKILLELLVKCDIGERVREVPIEFRARSAGKSKLNCRQRIRFLRHLVRLAVFRLKNSRLLGRCGVLCK